MSLNRAFPWLLIGCIVASFALLATLLIDVAADGVSRISMDFITKYGSSVADNAGTRAALLGTLWLMLVCAAFIIPVGVATAIYLEEYADETRWWNRAIEVNIQNLAAVPSIVYGILGLAFLVRGPFGMGQVVLAGGLTLGLLVLPAAVPGISTGVILALSRAIGETAPLIMVGAATFVAFDPDLQSAFTALPIMIFDWISRPSNSINDYASLAAGAIVVLMVLLLGMNAVAIWLRNRFEQKW